MKLRAKEELINFLDNSSKIRKRELISLNGIIQGKGREHEKMIACRSAILLSHAHWEGFVKEAAKAYISYVAFKAPFLDKVKANFQAIACKPYFMIAGKATNRIAPHIEIVRQFTDLITVNSVKTMIDIETAINTESNLGWDVFENICQTIGIDHNHWSINGQFINDLRDSRNSIAHGGLDRPDEKYSTEVIKFVLESIDQFKAQIENAALTDAYLR